GTTSVAAVNGVATFAGLTLNKAAAGYTLQVSSGSLTPSTTNPITVNAAAATHLVVTTQPPATITAGSGFGLVVKAEDDSGNVDTNFSGNVTMSLATHPG